MPTSLPLCLPAPQAKGAAVQADPAGRHAQRAAAYRSLVQQLLALDVHDGAAAQQLAAAVAAATGGDGGGPEE